MVQKKRVTVGGSTRDLGCSNGAAGSNSIFNQNGLTQRLAHRNGNHAGHHVGWTTGSKRYHHGYRFIWKGSLTKRQWAHTQSGYCSTCQQQGFKFEFHFSVSIGFIKSSEKNCHIAT